MTREQIIEKAKNYQGDKLSFIDGAEWMQEALTEKACKWLENRFGGKYMTTYDRGVLNDFRKTMEEQI